MFGDGEHAGMEVTVENLSQHILVNDILQATEQIL
jgi:hypothetical protein